MVAKKRKAKKARKSPARKKQRAKRRKKSQGMIVKVIGAVRDTVGLRKKMNKGRFEGS